MKTSNYYVYILECNDKTLYTGITNDLKRRLEMHNKKIASKYTRSRTPVKIVYYEEAENKSAALKRELAIKALSKTNKLKLINSKSELNKASFIF